MGSGFFRRSTSDAPRKKNRGGEKEPGGGGLGRERRGLVSKEKRRQEGDWVNLFFIFDKKGGEVEAFERSGVEGEKSWIRSLLEENNNSFNIDMI
jgi:hypothetical protein